MATEDCLITTQVSGPNIRLIHSHTSFVGAHNTGLGRATLGDGEVSLAETTAGLQTSLKPA